MSVLSGAGALG